MKGDFSCHSFTDAGRDNYDRIFRDRKRHQEICNNIPPSFHDAVARDYYRDLKNKTDKMCEEINRGPSPNMGNGAGCCSGEEEIELTAYDMMIGQGTERN